MQAQVLKVSGKRLSVGGKALFRNSTATINGHTYKTVIIGNQEWLAENFKYDDGESYIVTKDTSPYQGEKYYLWNVAVRVTSELPDGWHLPSEKEFFALAHSAGGGMTGGRCLKSTTGWDNDANGADSFGFSAYPNGIYYDGSHVFGQVGALGVFWSTTEGEHDYAKVCLNMYAGNSDFGPDEISLDERNDTDLLPIRLVRNITKPTTIGSDTYRTVTIGDQEWLAEDFRADDGGTGISTRNDGSVYSGEKYYTYDAAVRVSSNLTDGWHLPTTTEHNTLLDAVGGYTTAGTMLKSESGWNNNGNGIDRYGFTARPVGSPSGTGNGFTMWSATDNSDPDVADTAYMSYNNNQVRIYGGTKNSNLSVRLVRPALGYVFIGDRMYKTIKIGNQEWLAENLRLDDGGTGIYTNPSGTYAGEKYYDWDAAMRVSALVGNGWSLPSKTDFETLATSVGGSSTAGTVLKSTSGWNSSGNGSNAYRFEAVAAGYLLPPDINFYQGSEARFWSTTHIESMSYSYSCGISATSASISMASIEIVYKLTLRLVRNA